MSSVLMHSGTSERVHLPLAGGSGTNVAGVMEQNGLS